MARGIGGHRRSGASPQNAIVLIGAARFGRRKPGSAPGRRADFTMRARCGGAWMSERELEAPAGGWTMREAAGALLPDLLAAADSPPPRDWWMAGGIEYRKAERSELRRSFARIMESGRYRATGLVKGQEQAIPPELWRAATFSLSLPGEKLPPEYFVSGRAQFEGVRVYEAAFDRLPVLSDARSEAPATPASLEVKTDERPSFQGPSRWADLVQWALERYREGRLPERATILADHRHDFGRISGISEPIIRQLPSSIADKDQKKGGFPMQRRSQT